MKGLTEVRWKRFGEPIKVNALRDLGPVHRIRSYKKLRISIAELAFHNPFLQLFFRGQSVDSRDAGGRISILPSIFREQVSFNSVGQSQTQNLTASVLANRVCTLDLAESFLVNRLQFEDWTYGFHRMSQHSEALWAILQHYQVVPTPLLDLTSSLNVALHFAFSGKQTKKRGALYVIGVPEHIAPIHFDYTNELVLVRLSSIVSPLALRPHFQSAYFLGTWPFTRHGTGKKHDVASRLVAAFWLNSCSEM